MAFTQTQTLDNILLRGITFRTPANAAISSQYTLYANGQGQTYWSNSVAPIHISSLSTAIANDVRRLSTNAAQYDSNAYSTMAFMQSTIQIQSTGIVRLNNGLVSTTTRLVANDQAQSNSINVLSNNFNVLSNQLGNVLAARVDAIFTSTIRYVQSTLYGVSTFSTFYNEIDAVRSTSQALFSTLSTTTMIQNVSTYSTVTTNYNNAIESAIVSTNLTVNAQFSSISTAIANKSDLSTISSVCTRQLLSTSQGIYQNYSTIDGDIYNHISTVVLSSIQSDRRINALASDVFDLQQFSTTLSSINNLWISSFVSTSQSYQDVYINASIGKVSTSVGDLSQSTQNLAIEFSTFASTIKNDLSSALTIVSRNDSTIRGLQYEFSIITTSSILSGIYDTFMGLEGYTSTLIGSTIATTDTFKSTLYQSTVAQNMSISLAYFNLFVSTTYQSTLSTLIPSTMLFTSSMVSTLYSTSYTFMTSSLMSTMSSISIQYISTQSSLTQAIVLSTNVQMQSSILSYLVSPAASSLSWFYNTYSLSLSTFSANASSLIFTSQNQFISSFTHNQSTFNILQVSSIGLYASTTNALNSILAANTQILSSFSTSFGTNTSTQLGLYNSTVTFGFPSTMNHVINSTNTGIYALGTYAITSTINTVQASSINAFNIFMTGLTNQSATAALSSIYTVQNIELNGSNFVGSMDMVNHRNFNVTLYNLVNGSSNYRLNYPINSLNGLEMRKGIITINVSTVGSAYTNNNSLLRFDVYRWGIPTTVYGNMYPYISNADYTMQYEYTIQNQTIYTNLLNVYPRLAIRNPQISSIIKNVYIDNMNSYSSNHFWRGTPVQIGWSNYSQFPFGTLGSPTYNPEIGIDVIVNNSTIAEYGPYPLSQSTATIFAPYLSNQLIPVIPTYVRTYIVGAQRNYAETSFNTVLPTFDNVIIQPAGYPVSTKFMGGTELVAITDNIRYPVFNATANVATSQPVQFYNNDLRYAPQNLINGILNRAGSLGQDPYFIIYGGSNVSGQFSENSVNSGFADFYVNLNNYFPDLSTLQQYNSQITFTFSNAQNAYTFPSRMISTVGTNPNTSLYRVFNSTIAKSTNTFTTIGQTCYIRYRYSPIQYISTTGLYNESTFVGPIGPNNPDPATFLNINGLALSARMDPVSTIIYYGLSNAPINQSDVDGMTINANVQYGGVTYGSTINVSGSALTQTFRF